MYAISERMFFLRALAAAKQGDMVPMARLSASTSQSRPETGDYLAIPTFSDTMFFGVNCVDDSYFNGTQEERLAQNN